MNAKSEKFLIASGFLIAILLVWASLWTTTGQMYKDNGNTSMATVGLGLVSIYYALLASIMAFASIVFKRNVGRFAILAIGVSLTITALEVLFSLITAVWKLIANIDFWKPLPIVSENIPSSLPLSLIPYVVLPLLVFILWFALVYWFPTRKYLSPDNLFKETP